MHKTPLLVLLLGCSFPRASFPATNHPPPITIERSDAASVRAREELFRNVPENIEGTRRRAREENWDALAFAFLSFLCTQGLSEQQPALCARLLAQGQHLHRHEDRLTEEAQQQMERDITGAQIVLNMMQEERESFLPVNFPESADSVPVGLRPGHCRLAFGQLSNEAPLE